MGNVNEDLKYISKNIQFHYQCRLFDKSGKVTGETVSNQIVFVTISYRLGNLTGEDKRLIHNSATITALSTWIFNLLKVIEPTKVTKFYS